MSEAEAEAFRKEVNYYSEQLSNAELTERTMYGFMIAILIMGIVIGEARIGDIAYYFMKVLFDFALIICSIMSYRAYMSRSHYQEKYWSKVLGDMYRE